MTTKRLIGTLSRMTPRKKVLFACAALRRIADDMPIKAYRNLLKIQRDLCSTSGQPKKQLFAGLGACRRMPPTFFPVERLPQSLQHLTNQIATLAFYQGQIYNLSQKVESLALTFRRMAHQIGYPESIEKEQQQLILDDLAGPFHYACQQFPTLPADKTVQSLALAINREQSYQDLPVLADALEDAGCDDERLLHHCRSTIQTHFPGCWLIDTILMSVRRKAKT